MSHGGALIWFNFGIKLYAGLLPKKMKPPSLVSLCIGVIGKHLEDIITDLAEIAIGLPAEIKVVF